MKTNEEFTAAKLQELGASRACERKRDGTRYDFFRLCEERHNHHHCARKARADTYVRNDPCVPRTKLLTEILENGIGNSLCDGSAARIWAQNSV